MLGRSPGRQPQVGLVDSETAFIEGVAHAGQYPTWRVFSMLESGAELPSSTLSRSDTRLDWGSGGGVSSCPPLA